MEVQIEDLWVTGDLLQLAVTSTEVRRGVGYLFSSTNSWLIRFGGLLEGQCKVHADVTFALLVQPRIAGICPADLAIH